MLEFPLVDPDLLVWTEPARPIPIDLVRWTRSPDPEVPGLVESFTAARRVAEVYGERVGGELAPPTAADERNELLARLAGMERPPEQLSRWFAAHNGDASHIGSVSPLWRLISLADALRVHAMLCDVNAEHPGTFDASWIPVGANARGDFACATEGGAGHIEWWDHEVPDLRTSLGSTVEHWLFAEVAELLAPRRDAKRLAFELPLTDVELAELDDPVSYEADFAERSPIGTVVAIQSRGRALDPGKWLVTVRVDAPHAKKGWIQASGASPDAILAHLEALVRDHNDSSDLQPESRRGFAGRGDRLLWGHAMPRPRGR